MTDHMSPSAEALNDGQRTFCHEYLIDFNPRQAYIRAYNPNSKSGAKNSANRLMNKPQVQSYIKELIDRRNARTDVDADRVVLELARIGLSDIRKLMKWGDPTVYGGEVIEGTEGVQWFPSTVIDDDTAAAIAEVKETETEVTTENRRGDDRVTRTRTRSMKLHPKITALQKLADHVGVGRDAGVPGGMEINVTVAGMTKEEQADELTKLFEQTDEFREAHEIDEEGDMVELPEPGQ